MLRIFKSMEQSMGSWSRILADYETNKTSGISTILETGFRYKARLAAGLWLSCRALFQSVDPAGLTWNRIT